jgi:hypothetical protein
VKNLQFTVANRMTSDSGYDGGNGRAAISGNEWMRSQRVDQATAARQPVLLPLSQRSLKPDRRLDRAAGAEDPSTGQPGQSADQPAGFPGFFCGGNTVSSGG